MAALFMIGSSIEANRHSLPMTYASCCVYYVCSIAHANVDFNAAEAVFAVNLQSQDPQDAFVVS